MEMMNEEKLKAMKEVNVKEIDKSQLVDLKKVEIDRTLPVPERIEKFVRQIRNPYLVKVDNVVVKLMFTEGGPSCQEALYGMIDVIR